MKPVVLSIALVLACGPAAAQIPNPGFETWSAGVPTGWTSASAALPGSIDQSGTAHGGSSAAMGTVISFGGFAIPPDLVSGEDGFGFPETQRHATLTGYYQFTPVGGDAFTIAVGLIQGGTVIGAGAFLTTAAQSGYAQFNIPIFYALPGDPDSAYIYIAIVDTVTGTPNAGSSFLVDDLAWSGITDVGEPGPLPNRFALEQNYPNPFNPSTTIDYTLATTSRVSLRVYDMLGREVAVLAEGVEDAGAHPVLWAGRDGEGNALPSGVYVYRLDAVALSAGGGTFSEIRKMILMK